MGDLITKTPYSEITATLEILDLWGVKREHFERYRKASSLFQRRVAEALISGRQDFFLDTIPHAIDCDASPFIPDGWRVLSGDQLPNRVKGTFTWDPTKVKLYLSKRQKGDRDITGHNLRKELASQPVLPANVLDYLWKPENQHLIPEDGKVVFFWGTIYRDSGDRLYVRYLCRHGSGCDWYYRWLDDVFDSLDPALVRAS